jgi:hypothetical protein
MSTMGPQAEQHDEADEDEEGGIVLSPEAEAELEQVIAETDEDERAGRTFTLDQVLAGLRAT